MNYEAVRNGVVVACFMNYEDARDFQKSQERGSYSLGEVVLFEIEKREITHMETWSKDMKRNRVR